MTEALLHYVGERESAVLVLGYENAAGNFHRRHLLLLLVLLLREATGVRERVAGEARGIGSACSVVERFLGLLLDRAVLQVLFSALEQQGADAKANLLGVVDARHRLRLP